MESRDMENLEAYYWKKDIEWRLKEIINEIMKDTQKYWKLENWSYSLVDGEWKLIKEKEVMELWKKYFDENVAKNFDIFYKGLLTVLIWSFIWGMIIIKKM